MANFFRSILEVVKNLQSSKTVTAGTSQITVSPDTGYDAMEQVIVNPTPSTAITPSDSNPEDMSTGTLYTVTSSGKAVASVTYIIPSNSSPVSLSKGVVYVSNSVGYAISSYTSKTPSSSPSSVSSGSIYKITTNNGYLINSYSSSSVSPSSSGTSFSSGWNYMSSGGYAYDSQQSGFPDTMQFPFNVQAFEKGAGVMGGSLRVVIPDVIRDAYNYVTITWQNRIGDLSLNSNRYNVADEKRSIDKTTLLTISMNGTNNALILANGKITLSKT